MIAYFSVCGCVCFVQQEGDRFLMCSKKRPNNATSNYLVSMRAGDLDRNSNNFLGKLRANFVGTEFQASLLSNEEQKVPLHAVSVLC